MGFGFFFDPALHGGVDLGGEAGLGLGDAAVERGAHEGGGRKANRVWPSFVANITCFQSKTRDRLNFLPLLSSNCSVLSASRIVLPSR